LLMGCRPVLQSVLTFFAAHMLRKNIFPIRLCEIHYLENILAARNTKFKLSHLNKW
jgi:hypothetical protein